MSSGHVAYILPSSVLDIPLKQKGYRVLSFERHSRSSVCASHFWVYLQDLSLSCWKKDKEYL